MSFERRYTIVSGDGLLYVTINDGNLEQAKDCVKHMNFELFRIFFLVVVNLKIDLTSFKQEHDSKLIFGRKKRTKKNVFHLPLFQKKTYKKRTL